MQIRPAALEDAPRIAAVHVRSWREAYRGLLPQDLLDGLDEAQRAVAWSSALTNPDPRVQAFVAEDGGEVVGFVHVRPSRDAEGGTGEITCLYVRQAAWGRGAGRALMDAAVASMRGSGFAAATLWVLAANDRARRFYAAAGWTPDGTQRVEDRGGRDVLELRYGRPLEAAEVGAVRGD
ncbi:MAG: GNAT family N-acetyltransferase [Kineosporiaceae bacterium]